MDPRTRTLLEAPILPTLLRLAIPNVVTTTIQGSIGLIDIYFMAKLGTDAVAGVSLVFPGLMLMQMMSGGAMGGGISSAVARALGAGRRDDADAIVLHALVIGAIFAAFFCVAVVAGGPWLYAALGGSGAALDVALTYSNIVFGGVFLIWSFNVLANILRGTGNTAITAVVTVAGAVLLVPLSPCLIFGYGPFPKLGVAGGAIALLSYYGLGTIIYAAYLWSGRSVVRPNLLGTRLRWPLFYDIFRVGAVASRDFADDQRDDGAHDSAGRGVRRGGDRRLRRRHAARIHAGAAVVRVRRRAGRAGRHQYRGRSSVKGRCAPPGSAAGCRSR